MNERKEEGDSTDCYSSRSNDCYVRVKEERQNMAYEDDKGKVVKWKRRQGVGEGGTEGIL